MNNNAMAPTTRAEIVSCFDHVSRRPENPKHVVKHVAYVPQTPNAKSSQKSESFDSGYSSADSPLASQRQETAKESKPSLPPGVPVKLGGQDFLRFKKPLDQPTVERFNEVVDQIQSLLQADKEHGASFRRTVIRPMLLGTSEGDVHKYLVVLCPGPILRVVQDFFAKNKVVVKELCEPCNSKIPSFKVVIEGTGLRLKALLSDIWVFDDWCPETISFCGRPVKVLSPAGAVKSATCGGIIKVTGNDGRDTLYGMIAGHSLFGTQSSDGGVSEANQENEFDALSPASPKNPNADSRLPTISSMLSGPVGLSPAVDRYLSRVLIKQNSGLEQRENFDWALFEVQGHLISGPNMFTSKSPKEPKNHSLSTRVGRFPPGSLEQEVEMIGGPDGSRPGVLSSVSARIMLEAGESFSRAYILSLDEGEVADGDSGSWVVGSSSYDVFGHIVATDMFGDAYVVPLEGTLGDIQRDLGARSVQLPSEADFGTILPASGHSFRLSSPSHGLDFDPAIPLGAPTPINNILSFPDSSDWTQYSYGSESQPIFLPGEYPPIDELDSFPGSSISGPYIYRFPPQPVFPPAGYPPINYVDGFVDSSGSVLVASSSSGSDSAYGSMVSVSVSDHSPAEEVRSKKPKPRARKASDMMGISAEDDESGSASVSDAGRGHNKLPRLMGSDARPSRPH